MSGAMPELRAARDQLERWGRWWRWREIAECTQAAISPSAVLMEVCQLGVRVQTTSPRARLHSADAIRVPGCVEDMDERVSSLPREQVNALMLAYIRRDRRAVRALPLLRAELAIGRMISEHRRDESTCA